MHGNPRRGTKRCRMGASEVSVRVRGYGGCLTCPLYSPRPVVTRRWLAEYHRGL